MLSAETTRAAASTTNRFSGSRRWQFPQGTITLNGDVIQTAYWTAQSIGLTFNLGNRQSLIRDHRSLINVSPSLSFWHDTRHNSHIALRYTF